MSRSTWSLSSGSPNDGVGVGPEWASDFDKKTSASPHPDSTPSAQISPKDTTTKIFGPHSKSTFKLQYENLISSDAHGQASETALDVNIKDPATILPSGIHAFHIYIPADFSIPLLSAWMHLLSTSISNSATTQSRFPSLRNVQLYFRTRVRPVLEDLYIEHHTRKLVTAMLNKSSASKIKVETLFWRVDRDNDEDKRINFRKVDLMKAIQGLDEHTLELSEILEEESYDRGVGTDSQQIPPLRYPSRLEEDELL